MHNSSLVAIAQYFGPIRTSVLYGNRKKFYTEAVNDYPPIRFEIRFERKFPIVCLYFLTLPVETLRNLCPVEKLFGMRMAGLCQFYWRTCLQLHLRYNTSLYASLSLSVLSIYNSCRMSFSLLSCSLLEANWTVSGGVTSWNDFNIFAFFLDLDLDPLTFQG